jgi:hypothetical protein
MDALDDFRPDLGSQFGRAEHMEPGCERAGELLEKVLDAALAAAEVVEHVGPHDD